MRLDRWMDPRNAIKVAAHHSGLLPAWHRWRHAATLSVVMFHRVLPFGGDAWHNADPGYTVSESLFAECLRFFRRCYAVVGLHDVLASLDGGRPLPPCALLITFDDGWHDSIAYAWPQLRRQGLPAVVFVAGDALCDPGPDWWQDTLLRCLSQGRVTYEGLWRAVPGDDSPVPDVTAADRLIRLLLRFASLEAPQRRQIMAALMPVASSNQRDMIEVAALPRICADGLTIASHGASHLPLSLLPDPSTDLRRARLMLTESLGGDYVGARALSYPHGRYDRRSVAAAMACGFDLQFNSVACLNDAPAGRPASRLLGRIEIPAQHISDKAGQLRADRLATWLFNRPLRRLTEDAVR